MTGPWVVISLLIAITGWFATHLLNEARERRKEKRALLDKTVEKLWKIGYAARDFHCATTYSDTEAQDIIYKLQRLYAAVRRHFSLSPTIYTQSTIDLRQAITLKNYDKSTFSTQAINSAIPDEIIAATAALEDALEDSYSLDYPHKFPYFAVVDVQKVKLRLGKLWESVVTKTRS